MILCLSMFSSKRVTTYKSSWYIGNDYYCVIASVKLMYTKFCDFNGNTSELTGSQMLSSSKQVNLDVCL